jgi:hypothetical protein
METHQPTRSEANEYPYRPDECSPEQGVAHTLVSCEYYKEQYSG